jgi:uncharacterized membrane protein
MSPRRTRVVLLVLCALGVIDSAYLTSIHYQDVPLVCSASGVVDCSTVLHSSYATVAGIPVAVFGLVWFVVMGLLALRPIAWETLAWAVLGMASVLWLVYVELFRIDKICLWCSVAHVLVLTIFAIVLAAASARQPAVR